MSDKGIQFRLGGRFEFVVTKTFINDAERFSVRIGNSEGFGGSRIDIAEDVTWVEASQAMNRFKEEFETAFETLVQSSTLTPVGVHEES